MNEEIKAMMIKNLHAEIEIKLMNIRIEIMEEEIDRLKEEKIKNFYSYKQTENIDDSKYSTIDENFEWLNKYVDASKARNAIRSLIYRMFQPNVYGFGYRKIEFNGEIFEQETYHACVWKIIKKELKKNPDVLIQFRKTA